MKTALSFLLIGILALQARSQSPIAMSLLRESQNRISVLERKVDATNGTLKVSIRFTGSILGKKSSGSADYRIIVRNGLDAKNELVGTGLFSDSTVASMMERELRRRQDKPMMDLYLEKAFPWTRYLSRADKKREFTAEMESDSEIVGGKKCLLVSYTLDAEGDSVSAEGEGKIWIESESFLPVRAYFDFYVKSHRGKAEVICSSDFSSLSSGIPVILRSETQTIPKFLFISVGSIKTVVEQSDFNLE